MASKIATWASFIWLERDHYRLLLVVREYLDGEYGIFSQHHKHWRDSQYDDEQEYSPNLCQKRVVQSLLTNVFDLIRGHIKD